MLLPPPPPQDTYCDPCMCCTQTEKLTSYRKFQAEMLPCKGYCVCVFVCEWERRRLTAREQRGNSALEPTWKETHLSVKLTRLTPTTWSTSPSSMSVSQYPRSFLSLKDLLLWPYTYRPLVLCMCVCVCGQKITSAIRNRCLANRDP